MKLKKVLISEVLNQIPRLLSQLQKNPFFKTYGSFDWNFWQTRFTDFPSGHLQESVLTLALLYSKNFEGNIYFKSKKILRWAIASMVYWSKIQKKDGSYDEFYYNERQLGATAVSLCCITDAYLLLENHLTEKAKSFIKFKIQKSANWLKKNDEDTTLTNHQAQCLWALFNSRKILNSSTYDKAIKYRLKRIKKAFSKEGWFEEYGGADLGYLTVTMSFLTKYALTVKDEELLKMIDKCVDFVTYFIFPDYSYGGTMGSRNTAHFWPSAFVKLKNKNSKAAIVAEAFAEGMKRQILVTPSKLDHYYWEQIYDFIEAITFDTKSKNKNKKLLPYQKNDFKKYFKEAGIYVCKKNNFYIMISLTKGGIIKVWEIKKKKLIFSDCGLIIRTSDEKIFSTCALDKDYKIVEKDNTLIIKGKFHSVKDKQFSTITMVLFKTFQFLFSLNVKTSNLIKNVIINRFVKNVDKINLYFERKIVLDNKLEIEDTIFNKTSKKIKKMAFADDLFLSFVAYAKYFNSNELNTDYVFVKKDLINILNKKRKLKLNRIIF